MQREASTGTSNNVFDQGRSRGCVINAMKKAIHKLFSSHLSQSSQMVVEIGCGTGFFYQNFAPPQLRRQLVGVDNSTVALELFKESAPHAKVLRGDMDHLPFPDSSVDKIVGLSVYPLFQGTNTALLEANRVLKPGGKLIILQDSGLVNRDLVGIRGMAEEGAEGMELDHDSLLRRIPQYGFKVVEGSRVLEAAVISAYPDAMERFRPKTLDQIASREVKDEIVIGFTVDRGIFTAYSSLRAEAKRHVKDVEGMLGAGRVISSLPFRPGKDIFEYIRMRYIVAEKRKSPVLS
jgi:SAM-dependent methyltransferase